jgi:pyruvate kinase
MLAKIAAYTELHRPPLISYNSGINPPSNAAEAAGVLVEHALQTIPCNCIFVPTDTGATARMISRFNPPVSIVAICHDSNTCQGLMFSYGVLPVELADDPENWSDFGRQWLAEYKVPGNLAMLVAGPSKKRPDDNHRIEFLRLGNM